MPEPCRIVLADDHALVREALGLALESGGRCKIVASCGDGNEALKLVAEHKPDVLVMDIDMPGRTCFDVANMVASVSPRTRVMLLSGHSHDSYVQMALQARVQGFMTKACPHQQVERAILDIHEGKLAFAENVRARLTAASEGTNLYEEGKTPVDQLSPREREVLIQLARGLSVKEAATVLNLSRKTVDNHTQRLMAKLDIHSRADLVRFAWREKLVT